MVATPCTVHLRNLKRAVGQQKRYEIGGSAHAHWMAFCDFLFVICCGSVMNMVITC